MKNIKKILVWTLTVCMLLAVAIPTVSASTAVASINHNGTVTTYTTIGSAFSALQDGDTLKLLADYTTGSTINVTKTCTIDGGGYTWTYTGTDYAFAAQGKNPNADTAVTDGVYGSTITFTNLKITTDTTAGNNGGGFKFYHDMELVLGEGMDVATKNTAILCARKGGKLTVNGGTYTANSTVFSIGNSGQAREGIAAKAVFNNATVNTSSNAIVVNYGSDVVINGGTYTSSSAVVVKATDSSIAINGGTVNGGTSNTLHVLGNGTMSVGGNAVINSNSACKDKPMVLVEGTATFEIKENGAIRNVASNSHTVKTVAGTTVLMNGGTISNQTSTGAMIAIYGDMIMNAGTIDNKATSCGIKTYATTSNVVINGGRVIAGGDALEMSKGTVTVKGGSLSGGKVANIYDGATLNIEGGSHTGTYGVQFKNTATFNMTGGSIVLKSGSAQAILHMNDGTADAPSKPVVNVYGGYLANGTGRLMNGSDTTTLLMATVNIYGGTWKTDGAVGFRAGASQVYVYGGDFYLLGVRSSDGAVFFTAGKTTLKNNTGRKLVITEVAKNSEGVWAATGNMKVTYSTGRGASSITMMDGAAVRMFINEQTQKAENGIRFTTTISKDILDYAAGLADEGTKVTYGTVIAPTDKLGAYFTMDLLGASDFAKVEATEKGTTVNADGSVTIRCALTEIQAANLARDFSAVAYVCFVKNGQKVYIYGNFDAEKNTRNMSEVAEAALKDVIPVADKVPNDGYTVNLGNGYLSPYSEAQRAILQSYIVK